VSDLDRLEQLNRLRESGALTQDEFDQEKAAVLAADQAKFLSNGLKIAIAVAILISVIAIAILASRNLSAPGGPTEQVEALASPASIVQMQENGPVENIIVPNTDWAAPAPSATLDWAFSEQIIGLNPAYVETVLGPAKSKRGSTWEFDVKSCTVTYAVAENEITSASTIVKQGCYPKVMGTLITPQTTYGQIKGSYDVIRSWCIHYCGNAADPTIELYKPGSRANNFIDVVYSSQYGDSQAVAMDLWVKAIRTAHGINDDQLDQEDYKWYQCVSKPDAQVVRALATEQVGDVTIGRDLTGYPGCRFLR